MTNTTIDSAPANDVIAGDGPPCIWCKTPGTNHKHFAVLCRDLDGKLLGRLDNEGGATNRKLFALVLSEARATKIADKINADGEFTAKVIPF